MAFMWLVVIGTSLWVYIDAKSIGVRRGQLTGVADMSPVGWAIGSLLIWIVAFPLYLVKRPEYRRLNGQSAARPSGVPWAPSVPSVDDQRRKCPFCAEPILAEASMCRFCSTDVVPIKVACVCGHSEDADRRFCTQCGSAMTVSSRPSAAKPQHTPQRPDTANTTTPPVQRASTPRARPLQADGSSKGSVL